MTDLTSARKTPASAPLATPEAQKPSAAAEPQPEHSASRERGGVSPRLEAILESSSDALVAAAPDGHIIAWNPGAERLTGYSAEEMIGTPGTLLMPSERQKENARIRAALVRGEEIPPFQSVVVRKDGVHVQVLLTLSPIKSEAGEVLGISAIARDLSSHQREAEERRAIMSGAHCLIWYADVYETTHPRYLHWDFRVMDTEAAQRFMPLSLNRGERYKDGWYRHRHPEDQEACDRLGTASIRAGKSYEQEFRCQRADGDLRWIHESVKVETLQAGRHWRAVAVCTDITPLKELESSLRESERKAQLIAEAMPQIVWTAHPDGELNFISGRWKDLTGQPPEAGLGSGWERFVHPQDGEDAPRLWDRAAETGRVFEREMRLLRVSDHTYRWHLSRALPLRDADGKIWMWAGTTTDIDDLKRLEAGLRDSEARYRFLAESIPHLVWATQPDGTIDYFNPRCIEYTGCSLADLFGWGWKRVVHPEDFPAVLHLYQKAIQEGTEFQYEYRIRRFDGVYRWHQGHALPLREENGTIVRWFGTCTDVDAMKQAEASLRESEQRLKAALDAGSMGIWEWDLISNAVTWSAETERLFGMEPGAFDGSYEAYQQFLHPDDKPHVSEALQNSLRNRTPYEHEHRVVWRDGSLHWIVGKGGAFYDAAGKPIKMLGTVTDITDRKRLEQQFLQAQKMEGIGRLAGGIAHDFNNLLSVILGYSEMVELELAEDSPLKPNVRSIQSAATRAAKLTGQLLAFARRQVSAAQVLSPNEVIAGMSEILKPLIREDIELLFSLNDETGFVKADPSQLEQVIVNLVVNARDALPGPGKITLQTENVTLTDFYLREDLSVTPGEYVLIAVSDTGTGMSPEVKNRLFEPFFTTKEVGKGTGLGLSTVYGIVKQSGGYLFAYSEMGLGTTMKIYLPRVLSVSGAKTEEKEKALSVGGTETLLVVEDERLVRDLTVSTLRKGGYRVLEAQNGAEALKTAEEFREEISLVVTDAVMPVMNGKELADRLKERFPSLPVMYVSGYTEEVTSTQGILPEGTPFLQKPFTSQGLLKMVRGLLDSPPAKPKDR